MGKQKAATGHSCFAVSPGGQEPYAIGPEETVLVWKSEVGDPFLLLVLPRVVMKMELDKGGKYFISSL